MVSNETATKWRWVRVRRRLVAMEQSRRGCVGEGSVQLFNGARTGFWLFGGAGHLRRLLAGRGGWIHSPPKKRAAKNQHHPSPGARSARRKEIGAEARKRRQACSTMAGTDHRPGAKAATAQAPGTEEWRRSGWGIRHTIKRGQPNRPSDGDARPRGERREKFSQAGSRRRPRPLAANNNQCPRNSEGIEPCSPSNRGNHETDSVGRPEWIRWETGGTKGRSYLCVPTA
jgi:hypothetical protein